jgi:two-component system, NarL family, sensor histidine kinase DevS
LSRGSTLAIRVNPQAIRAFAAKGHPFKLWPAPMDGQSDVHPAPGLQLSDGDLTKLLEVGRTLVAELDVETVLRKVLETARELTTARYAALGILSTDKGELERFVFLGIDEETQRAIGPLPRGRGVLGELIRNPQPLRLSDVTEHPRSYGFPPGHPPMKTFLGVPVVIRAEAWGNLYLTDKAGRAAFDERDEEVTIVLAEWASIAIGNARLYEDVARRRGELERVVRGLEATAAVARAVGFETDLHRVLELIVKRGRALVDARSLIVLLEDSGELCVAAAAGELDTAALGTRLRREGTLLGSVMATDEPERIVRLADRVGHGLEDMSSGATTALVVPLGFRGRARGVLVALDKLEPRAAFGPEDAHLLKSYGASAAIAIATAQSVEAGRLRDTIRASESERGRWARELHDETLQDLGALKVLLQSAHASGRPETLQKAAENALAQLELSITSLQSLITELRPAALDELGLQPALEALARRTSGRFGVDVESSFALEDLTRLTPEIESTAYRLVQEALTNAVKHASGERIEVTVVEDAGKLLIAVRDYGVGFDPETPAEGFGLLGMRERVELVDGRLTIDSEPGRGTVVRADLPALHRASDSEVSEPPMPRSAEG